MRQPVELLLKRMESHPDEFLIEPKSGVSNKFLTMINQYRRFFTDEEKSAIDSKLSQVNLDRLLQRSMDIIFPPKEEEEDDVLDASTYATKISMTKLQIEATRMYMEDQLKREQLQLERDKLVKEGKL